MTPRGRLVILDSFAIDQTDPETFWKELGELAPLAIYPQTEEQEILSRDWAGAFAVLTNKVPLGAAQLRAVPSLRWVGVTATGTNNIDREAARAAGVAVTNVPDYAGAERPRGAPRATRPAA